MEEEEEEEVEEGGFLRQFKTWRQHRAEVINIYPELLSWAVFFCATLLICPISRKAWMLFSFAHFPSKNLLLNLWTVSHHLFS